MKNPIYFFLECLENATPIRERPYLKTKKAKLIYFIISVTFFTYMLIALDHKNVLISLNNPEAHYIYALTLPILGVTKNSLDYIVLLYSILLDIFYLLSILYGIYQYNERNNNGYNSNKEHHENEKNYFYKLSILGYVAFFISLITFQHHIKIGYFLLLISGLVCIVAIIRPTYNHFKEKNYPIFLVKILTIVAIYILSIFGDMEINLLFSIDASYFPKTRVISATLFANVAIFISSLMFTIAPIFTIKKSDHKISYTFFTKCMRFFISISIFYASIGVLAKSSDFLVWFATHTDFNEKSVCDFQNDNRIKGSIILNSPQNTALVYMPNSKPQFQRKQCIKTP